jgi:hypothetical protein
LFGRLLQLHTTLPRNDSCLGQEERLRCGVTPKDREEYP